MNIQKLPNSKIKNQKNQKNQTQTLLSMTGYNVAKMQCFERKGSYVIIFVINEAPKAPSSVPDNGQRLQG